MAIYHCAVKVVSRGKGQSAIAKAAYNARDNLRDEQTGEKKDYSRKAEEVLFSGIFTPPNAPAWAHDRNALWNAAELAENRKDSQLAREVEIALPHELTDQQREWLVKDYVKEAFTRHGMIADVNIHAPDKDGDGRNYHAHILLTTREITPDGFGPKVREWNSKEMLQEWRERLESTTNRHLERHGHEVRVDCRTLDAQGIDRDPTTHKGPQLIEMEARGVVLDVMERRAAEQMTRANDNEPSLSIRDLKAELAVVSLEISALEIGREVEPQGKIYGSKGDEIKHDAWADRAEGQRAGVAKAEPDLGSVGDLGLDVLDGATGAVTKLAEFASDLLCGGPHPMPADQVDRIIAQRRASAALENIHDSLNEGLPLAADDIRALPPTILQDIRDKGSDHLKALVQMMEAEKDRERDYGRTMER